MKLDGEEGKFIMLHALIASIVGIDKPGRKLWRQRSDSEAMILCCDIAALAILEKARLILASVPKL